VEIKKRLQSAGHRRWGDQLRWAGFYVWRGGGAQQKKPGSSEKQPVAFYERQNFERGVNTGEPGGKRKRQRAGDREVFREGLQDTNRIGSHAWGGGTATKQGTKTVEMGKKKGDV